MRGVAVTDERAVAYYMPSKGAVFGSSASQEKENKRLRITKDSRRGGIKTKIHLKILRHA